jgi:hypothetical protein
MEELMERSLSLREMYPNLEQSMFEGEPLKASYASMYEFITEVKEVHDFCLQCGLLLPNLAGVEVSKVQTSWGLRVWNRLIQLLFLIGTIIIFIFGVFGLTTITSSNMVFVFICFYFGITVQNILIIPSVVVWNRELLSPRRIPSNLYRYSFIQAKQIGTIILFIFNLFSLLLSIMCLISFSKNAAYIAISVIIIATGFFPINFILTGLAVFYIMEQRATYQIVAALRLKAENAELTCREYLNVRNDIEEKDKLLGKSLAWLIGSALWNTIIGIVIICALNSFLSHSEILREAYMIIFAVVYFGKQTGLLIVLLEEIGTINDLCKHALRSLAQRDFSLIYNPDQKVQDQKELERIKLCITLRECPVSATVGGWRFSKMQLRLQIIAAVLSYSIAVLRMIVLSSLNRQI